MGARMQTLGACYSEIVDGDIGKVASVALEPHTWQANRITVGPTPYEELVRVPPVVLPVAGTSRSLTYTTDFDSSQFLIRDFFATISIHQIRQGQCLISITAHWGSDNPATIGF